MATGNEPDPACPRTIMMLPRSGSLFSATVIHSVRVGVASVTVVSRLSVQSMTYVSYPCGTTRMPMRLMSVGWS